MKRSLVLASALTSLALSAQTVHTGQDAFRDWNQQKPGERVHLTVNDLPAVNEAESVDNGPKLIPRPAGAMPIAPAGFKVTEYASGFREPRLIRTAPNGDIFVADSHGDTIYVLRGVGPDGKAQQKEVFAKLEDRALPFGINFYPADNPKWVYVANTVNVIRFPYKTGDLHASGAPEVVVKELPGFAQLRGGGHWTRDVVFSKDGSRMFVSVGSHSNVDDVDMCPGDDIKGRDGFYNSSNCAHPQPNPNEVHRADVLEFTPEGKFIKVYASGIRNCVGEAIHPQTGELWCSTNERDRLGNHLVPDYITHVQEDGFYGWPWFYMGGTQDPRHAGKHPELKNKVITPDILVQPHMASLEMTFYTANAFPAQYRGGIFASEHGSWNRKNRAGYEVIFAPLKNGKAIGEYSDFLTGFVTKDGSVWGRPVGVTVGKDGSLFVSDDGSKTIWHVTYVGK